MVGYHHQAAAFLEAAGGAVQELLQGAHFLVHLYPQGLVHLGQHFVFGPSRQHAGDGAVQVSGGADGGLGTGLADKPGHVPGAVHLSVEPEDTLQLLFRVAVHHLLRVQLRLPVHAHVQRGILEAEAEAALRGVKLMGTNAEICQNAVELNPFVPGIVFDEAEVVVDEGEAGVLQRTRYRIDVTIEGDDAPVTV